MNVERRFQTDNHPGQKVEGRPTTAREIRTIIDGFELWKKEGGADGYNVAADRLATLMAFHIGQTEELKRGGFPEVYDQQLLGRAVKNARSRNYNKGSKHPRWVAVMDIFALGSGYAMELCRRFDFDPDEEVSR